MASDHRRTSPGVR